jgi:hypothetical protein
MFAVAFVQSIKQSSAQFSFLFYEKVRQNKYVVETERNSKSGHLNDSRLPLKV